MIIITAIPLVKSLDIISLCLFLLLLSSLFSVILFVIKRFSFIVIFIPIILSTTLQTTKMPVSLYPNAEDTWMAMYIYSAHTVPKATLAHVENNSLSTVCQSLRVTLRIAYMLVGAYSYMLFLVTHAVTKPPPQKMLL